MSRIVLMFVVTPATFVASGVSGAVLGTAMVLGWPLSQLNLAIALNNGIFFGILWCVLALLSLPFQVEFKKVKWLWFLLIWNVIVFLIATGSMWWGTIRGLG